MSSFTYYNYDCLLCIGAKKTTALPQAGKTLGKIPEDSAGMFDTTDGGFDTTDGGFDTTCGTGLV